MDVSICEIILEDIPKENGELPHTNESKNDEEINETEEPKLETLPGNCDVDIKKKYVIETTPVEEINIKNYHNIFSSSVGSKGFSQLKQGCTGAGEPSEDLTSHHLSSFLSLCVILTTLKLYCLFWTLPKQARIFFGDINVKSFHPCLPGSVMEPFPEQEDMSLSPPQKYTGLLSGDAYQGAEWGITRHIEEDILLDVTSEEEEESLFVTENNQPQRVSEHHLTVGVSHISGKAYQREKRVDGYGEVSRDSSDSWKTENAMKCKDFLPIKAKREAWTKQSEKSHSDISLCKTHETPDGTGHNQKLSISDKQPEVCASGDSGVSHQREKYRENAHIQVSWDSSDSWKSVSDKQPKDYASSISGMSHQSAKKRENEYIKKSHFGMSSAEEQESLKDTENNPQLNETEQHPQVCTSGISDESYQRGKKIVNGPVQESHSDMSSAEKKERLMGTEKSQEPSVCKQPTEACASSISVGSYTQAKNRTNEHGEDAGPVSSYTGEKGNPISTKTEEAGLEDVPQSQMVSKDVHALYKHMKPTIKSKDTALKKQKWWKQKIKRKSDSHCHMSSEELKEGVDGMDKSHGQSVCKQPTEACASSISVGSYTQAKNRTNEHGEDAGPVSSYTGEKGNPISTKTEEAGLEDVPQSQMVSKDVHALYKHMKPTIKSKDTALKKQKWWKQKIKRKSDSHCHMSSEELKEGVDGMDKSHGQSVCKQPTEACASSISVGSYTQAKNRTNEHGEDAGPVSSYTGEKGNPISTKTEEAGLEDVPQSQMVSKDVHALYKHMKPTIKSKDTALKKQKWWKQKIKRKSDSHCHMSSEELKEGVDGMDKSHGQSVCKQPTEACASSISVGSYTQAKNRTNEHGEDAGPVSSYTGEKGNPISTKTEEAGLEDVPQSQMVSKDVHALYKHMKPTIKSKDTALKKQKWWKQKIKRKSDSHCHMSSEELKEGVDGMDKSHGQSVCKQPTEACASSISVGSYTQAKNRTNEHGEDAGPVSSYTGEKGNPISTKTEEAGLEDVPQSQMVSKDVHALYKHMKPTIKSKDTALKKQKWWKQKIKRKSDSHCHMSSEELKEGVDGMDKSHGQSVCKQPTEACASSISVGSYTQAKNRTNEHGEDAGPVSSYTGEKGNPISTKTEEAGLEDVPQSQMVSKDVHALYKHMKPTIKSKDTALKKQKWWKQKIKRKSDSHCHMSSEELKEGVDGMDKSHGQNVCEKPPEVCTSSISGVSSSQSKNRINGHREDAGPVSLYKGEKEIMISTKTKEAGLEDVPCSQMESHWDKSSSEEKKWLDVTENSPQQVLERLRQPLRFPENPGIEKHPVSQDKDLGSEHEFLSTLSLSVHLSAESNLYRSSEAEQKRLHDMDANAHHQQKSDSEKHQKVCAACGSRIFEPSTKTINGHGQGKSEIRKITEEEGVKTEKGTESHLGKICQEEQQRLEGSGHSKQQAKVSSVSIEEGNRLQSETKLSPYGMRTPQDGYCSANSDSEKHQEMCAASESVEINASTKKGINELVKVGNELRSEDLFPQSKVHLP
ncbi:titin homolog [Marmota flaviventris]|uniref:titin homolog n=1 Tax=Marmota flaviventris TaxID=93162 RepID=UPI003A8B353F